MDLKQNIQLKCEKWESEIKYKDLTKSDMKDKREKKRTMYYVFHFITILSGIHMQMSYFIFNPSFIFVLLSCESQQA